MLSRYKLAIAVLMHCYCLIMVAQSGYNITFDTSNYSNGLKGIVKTDSGYACVGFLNTHLQTNSQNQAVFLRISQTQNHEVEAIIKNDSTPYFFSGGSGFFEYNNCYYACGNTTVYVDSVSPRTRGIVYKFTKYGDTLWTKVLSDTALNGESIINTITQYNSHIYISGYHAYFFNGNSIRTTIVSKLDTLGNIVWQKLISSPYLRVSGVKLLSANAKLYLSGYEFNQSNAGHSYSCNIDANGDTSNFRRYFQPVSGNQYIYKIYPNGDYITIGNQYFQNFILQDSYAMYVAKYNANGIKLWEKEYLKYHDWDAALEYDIFSDAQNNLYFLGNGLYHSVLPGDYGKTNQLRCFILKTDANGDSLWMRQYSRDDAGMYPSGWVQNDDGGFTVCGSVLGNNIPGQWDAWLMRVDSNGCIDEFCTPVGIKEEESPTNLPQGEAIKLYPNPNNGSFTINYQGILNKQTTLTITDALGQIVDVVFITQNLTEYKNIQLPNGIYFYTITTDNEVVGRGKFLLQK